MGRIADGAGVVGGAKVLTLDIETSAHTVKTWGLRDQNIGLNQIVDVGRVICFAAKWYGDRRVMFRSDFHDGHDTMVTEAWRLLNAADILVTYNGRSFDVKHLHREFVLAGLPPPAPHRDVDLLTVARQRFKFASNKLEHVANQLGLGGKVKHAGFDLWTGCEAGDEKAWRDMKRYNVQDVRLTEAVYDRLRPWIKNHPHPGLFGGPLDVCPNCGGCNFTPSKPVTTPTTSFPGWRCSDCGANARGAKRLRPPTGRRSA